ncbi:hypothetical protein V8C86DRAFT_3201779 [Haematococcus lacustris]
MLQVGRPASSTNTMAQTSRRPNRVDPVAIASNGNFFRFGQRCTAIRKECHEPSLATCETLMLNIDSESIFSSLSPRLLTALRARRLPLALQLIVTTPLKPHIFRGTVEGVLGLLGYCEAVHSVEIRFIYKQQAMEEAPTYAQLPVGAWLAERMMANFPQCLSLRLRGLQCAHPELAELLSHSQFMGRLQQLDIQQLHIQHGSVLDGHYEWVKAYLRLTTLSTVYLGPVPTSLQTCPSRLVKLSVTEMYLTAISLMPESIESLHISHLHVALPEPHQQALTNGVTALSSGRFTTLEIESVSLYFTSLEGGGHASLAALKPLVGRFGRAEVELGVIAPNGEYEVELVIHNLVPLLQGCAGVVLIGLARPLSSWCMHRLKGIMAQGATVEVEA